MLTEKGFLERYGDVNEEGLEKTSEWACGYVDNETELYKLAKNILILATNFMNT